MPGADQTAGSPARRVLLATNNLRVGGAETQLIHLARALVAAGDEVRLLSLLPTEAYGDVMDELGIAVDHVPSRRLRAVTMVRHAATSMRAWRPDVVVSFLYQANVVCRLAGRWSGSPVVISSFRNERFGSRGREVVLRITDRLATVSTTNSERVAESLVARGIVPEHRLRVIRNGLEPARFDRAAGARDRVRAGLGAADDTFVWLAAGRLEPQKDHDTLLAAFAAHHRACGSRLWIAGDGRRRAELEGRVAALGLDGAVDFLGIRADLPEVMAGSDAVVQASAWEGLPNVVIEAMAARRPVVATDVGGTAELVNHGVTGMLVPARDPYALAAALGRVVAAGAGERAEMGAAGRAVVDRRFSVLEVTREWLALIDEFHRSASPPVYGR